MKTYILPLLCLCSQPAFAATQNYLQHPQRTEWEAGGFYSGRFADGSALQMNLPYLRPAAAALAEYKHAEMFGAYWLPQQLAGDKRHFFQPAFQPIYQPVPNDNNDGGNALQIAVEVRDKQDQLVRREHVQATLSADKLSVQGRWFDDVAMQSKSFTLHKRFSYRAVQWYEAARDDGDGLPPHPFLFSAYFPVTGQAAIDTWIRRQAATCSDDQDCDNRIEIAWSTPAMLSLHAAYWGYNQRAAHGNGYAIYRHYRNAQPAVPLRLDHFFDTSPVCLNVLSGKIVAALRQQGLSWPENGVVKDWKPLRFLASPQGLQFDYDPYEVGSYAEGAPSVFIARRELGACLRGLPAYPEAD